MTEGPHRAAEQDGVETLTKVLQEAHPRSRALRLRPLASHAHGSHDVDKRRGPLAKTVERLDGRRQELGRRCRGHRVRIGVAATFRASAVRATALGALVLFVPPLVTPNCLAEVGGWEKGVAPKEIEGGKG